VKASSRLYRTPARRPPRARTSPLRHGTAPRPPAPRSAPPPRG
jgi:hypothetical protein